MELDFLFLVYEYIENGTLADHLRSSKKDCAYIECFWISFMMGFALM